jgi:hypothetical protein
VAVIIASGLAIGLIAAYAPVASYSLLQSTFTTPVSAGPNNYESVHLSMTKGETVSFNAVLDNKTAIRFYIFNSSQLALFGKCAPRCIQPLLGGTGSYFQQAGLSRPDLFLNTSVSETKPYSGNFSAPTSGPFYFVFDNSVGGRWSNYVAQNATGFATGSIRMSVFQVEATYVINWELAIIGVAETIFGGILATIFWQPNLPKIKLRREGLVKRFGTIIAIVAVLGTLIIDVPIFYAAATNSQNALLPGFGIKGSGQSVQSPVQTSNYSVFEIDSDYLSNVGSAGYGAMSVDGVDQYLFVAAPQNNSIYIYDLPNEAESDISGFNSPQSVLYAPNTDNVFVANAGNGTVDILSINSTTYPLALQRIAEIPDLPGVTSLVYDASSGFVYAGYGSGNQSGIAVINANTTSKIGNISLSASPGQMVIEQNGTWIFASVGSSIDVIDKTTGGVINSFPTSGALGLDEADNQLFVGTSNPPQLQVLDDRSGTVLTSLSLPSVPGNVNFDPISKLVMASCFKGTLEVFQQEPNDTGAYFSVASEPTGPGASQSAFFPDQELLYVAIPQYPYQLAQLMTFGIYSD